MGYVNIGGMHYIHFAKDTTPLHEFDYDNQVGNQISKRKNIEKNKMQTTMYTVDSQLVIKRIGKKKSKATKAAEEEIKKNATIIVKKSRKKDKPLVVEEKPREKVKSKKENKSIIKDTTKNTNIKSPKLKDGCLGNDPKLKTIFESLLNEMN